jgi:hypothetical protein
MKPADTTFAYRSGTGIAVTVGVSVGVNSTGSVRKGIDGVELTSWVWFGREVEITVGSGVLQDNTSSTMMRSTNDMRSRDL